MYDVLYIAVIIGFFALMLAFVRGLQVLGGDAVVDGSADTRPSVGSDDGEMT